MDAYSIIIKPHVTEKTMNLIDLNNEITFVVRRTANKGQIKRAFEELYGEKVAKVNTHILTASSSAISSSTSLIYATFTPLVVM